MSNSAALITGASRGIGRAIAEKISKSGIYVYLNYNKNIDQAKETMEHIYSCGGQGEIIQASIADEGDVLRMFNHIKSKEKKLEVLINNAGVTNDKLLGSMKIKDWQDVINTNLTGIYFCSHQAIKVMIMQKSGCIVNVSSVSGIRGALGQTNYSATKAGIIAFTKSLAMEVGKFNIRVNCVAPGFIDTDLLTTLPLLQRKQLGQRCALGRVGSAEEVANVVEFLTSQQASYIQGQTIVIDGGML